MKIKLGHRDKGSDKDELSYFGLSHSNRDHRLNLKEFIAPLRRKKFWMIAIPIILVAGLIWYLSQSWLIQGSFSQTITYPQASVAGINVGDLNKDQLNSQLAQLKSKFETQKITLVNDKNQWVFDPSQLGIVFDTNSTSQAIWKLNELNIMDKYRLMTGGISSTITPTISVDNESCIKALSVISISEVKAKDAAVYFDQDLKIQPDQTGNRFSAIATCQELPKQLAADKFVSNILFDTTPAKINKSDLESKLSQIRSLVGKSMSFKSGSYQLTLAPNDLLGLLEISKKGSDVQISWSSTKLDNIINSIATKVNTSNSRPALKTDQYIVSIGGHLLDKTATKKIFTNLGTDSPRSYTLSIVNQAPVIGTRIPVVPGSKVVYLTFDDGLLYGNQIMDYAAAYRIKVTFFEIGSRVGTDAVALRRAIAEGHSVQSHGYEHAMYDYGQRSYAWQLNDLKQSVDAITSVTGVRPTYFRPPGGNRSNNTYKAAAANDLKLILWGVSSADTVAGFGSATICSNVLKAVFPGASVLMHSSKQKTADAVPCIIEGLAAKGYSMEALR